MFVPPRDDVVAAMLEARARARDESVARRMRLRAFVFRFDLCVDSLGFAEARGGLVLLRAVSRTTSRTHVGHFCTLGKSQF